MKERATFPNRPTAPLVVRAQTVLRMTHRQFGEALGASERTSARWARGSSSVSVEQLCALAKLVYPRDPELAGTLAEASSETLESLGIVATALAVPASSESAPAPRLAPRFVADLVVCAAADVLGVAPRSARAALLAAFSRAREMGLSVAEVEEALAGREG
jgi:transcriptional regulator with XRE-family HTH domain